VIVFALSTGNKLGLGLIAAAFIAFALVSSMVLPRKRPDFPGKFFGPFLGISALFFVAMVSAVFLLAKEAHHPGEAAAGGPEHSTQTGVTSTSSAPAPTTGAAALAAGKKAFDKAACGGCHTLADANASGKVGPNLDQLKPDAQLVEETVTNGRGSMPSFKGILSPEEIKAVSEYVAQSAGKA
jgi:mono/diheme cytochrome c family protein